MQDEFLRLQNLLHKTIVFITHDFDEAIRLADRIAIMKDGEIIQIGSPEELVTQPGDRLRGRVHPRRAAGQGHLGRRPDAALPRRRGLARRASDRRPRPPASRQRSSPAHSPSASSTKPATADRRDSTRDVVIDLLAGRKAT